MIVALLSILAVVAYLLAGVLAVRGIMRFSTKTYDGHLQSGSFADSLERDRGWAGIVVLIWPVILPVCIVCRAIMLLGRLAGAMQ